MTSALRIVRSMDEALAYYELTDIHPAAELLPLLPQEELAALAESGRAGWHLPIIVDGYTLIDGRNRILASLINGVDVELEELGDRDPLALITQLNVDRRHLSESQRAMYANRLATLQDGQHSDSAGAQICAPAPDEDPPPHGRAPFSDAPPPIRPPMTQQRAADLASVSRRSVQTARKIADAAPDLAKEVTAGTLSLHGAAKKLTERTTPTSQQEREKIGRDGIRAAQMMDGLRANVIAIAGAIQTGFTEIDGYKAVRQLREAADDLTDMMEAVTQ